MSRARGSRKPLWIAGGAVLVTALAAGTAAALSRPEAEPGSKSGTVVWQPPPPPLPPHGPP